MRLSAIIVFGSIETKHKMFIIWASVMTAEASLHNSLVSLSQSHLPLYKQTGNGKQHLVPTQV